MTPTLTAKEQSLAKIFSDDYVFTIPGYQRPYAWGRDQAQELLDDLLGALASAPAQLSEAAPYFLGSIVLIKAEGGPEATVVDGQQRLTTLTLLLSAIRATVQDSAVQVGITRRIYEHGDVVSATQARYRLLLRERDRDFFRQYVQHENGLQAMAQLNTVLPDAQARLRVNAQVFMDGLAKLGQADLVRLVQFVITRCYLVTVATPDLDSAYRIFGVLNSRGLDLSATDILKAEVIGGIEPALRDAYTKKWEDEEEDLGRDEFGDLFSHIRMVYRKAKPQGTLLKEFKEHVAPASRKEAVRWQKAIRGYITRQGYALGVLVAFSGEVLDEETYPEAVTETSQALNPGLKGRDIREVFKEPEHHLLLVANKFQTGFDQPLLCGMYVDKQLGGIQAVQTLSRLNRAYPGKDTTYILDFVNEPAEILKAFKAYHETAELESATDPHLVYDLRAKLDATGHYDEFEVERVVQVEVVPNGTQKALDAAITPVADRLLKKYKAAQANKLAAEEGGDAKAAQMAKDEMDALLLFKSDMGAYQRLYAFLGQIFDYGNTAIEKRFMFFRRLLPLLDFGRERDTVDLSKVVLTHHTLKSRGKQPMGLNADGTYKLPPMDAVGSGSVQEKERAYLVEIIEKVNGLFEGDLSDGDQLVYVNGVLKGKLLENETLVQQAASNSKEQFANSPDLKTALVDAIMDTLEAYGSMGTQALNSERVRDGLKDALLGPAHLYEALRSRSAAQGPGASL
ncbi:hypothetical protein DBA29_01470 [Xenophilus aerolatus]|nr:hypothetical protein [Xenophilus aerolatus]